MAQTTVTTFDADGTVIDVHTVNVPVDPTPDLPTLADQITQLNDAVNLLILTALGV